MFTIEMTAVKLYSDDLVKLIRVVADYIDSNFSRGNGDIDKVWTIEIDTCISDGGEYQAILYIRRI